MSAVSYYQNVYGKKETRRYEIDEILHDIKEGRWQNEFLKVSAEHDKEKRNELKLAVPCFTGSGQFTEGREDKDLKNSFRLYLL